MLGDLFKDIESDQVAAEFYLAGDTESLYRWIGRLPAVVAVKDLVKSDRQSAELLASRALELFHVPVTPGFRSEHEAALCCYACILCQTANERAREALRELYEGATPAYGWLRRLLDYCLSNVPETTQLAVAYAPPVI